VRRLYPANKKSSKRFFLDGREVGSAVNAHGRDYVEIADGEIALWIEQVSSIQLKVVGSARDPVELTEADATRLAEALLQFAHRIG